MNWGNAAIAKINSVLHGLEADIRAGASTITDPQFLEAGQIKRFSLVLANFPFSDEFWWLKPELMTDDSKKRDKLKREIFGKEGYKDPFGRFGRGTGFKAPPAAYGDYAFILHIVASLSEKGRAGIVCPQGVLFRGQPEIEEETGEFDEEGNPKLKRRKADDEHLIRKALIDARLIDAVISLPLNVFYGAGVPACLLVFHKERPPERRDRILLIYAARHYRQLSAKVARKACALYKNALDAKLKARGLPPEWTDVIIPEAQNSEPVITQFEYPKGKQDELIEYFKLTPAEWEVWNRERHGDDRSKWRPPLKILIVCDRLLTGFDAPVEQVMYLDKPLRDHNLLQAIARTNRRLPIMQKRTGVVVDYFGVFTNLEKALNFDEAIREESLIDWDALRRMVPDEVDRCMAPFAGITIADTRECLLAALRRLRDPETGKTFEQNFKSLERLWEAVAPDPCLYPHRHQYTWLCGIYVAYRRRQRGSRDTYGELSAKTRQLIQENTAFIAIAEALPVFRIDENYVARLDELPTPADKAAALEAILTAELAEDDPSLTYRQLGERLKRIKERKDASDEATARRLKELEEIAAAAAATRQEPERLDLKEPGEYGLYTILRAHALSADETYLADCARRMVGHLRRNGLLAPEWSNSIGGRMRVEQSVLAESWNPSYAALGFDPDALDPPSQAGGRRTGQVGWRGLKRSGRPARSRLFCAAAASRTGWSRCAPPVSCASGSASTASKSSGRPLGATKRSRHFSARMRNGFWVSSNASIACGGCASPSAGGAKSCFAANRPPSASNPSRATSEATRSV